MTTNLLTDQLVTDWTHALLSADIGQAQELLLEEPELLWTPIPHTLDNIDSLNDQLIQLGKLGTTFQPVSAIQFICLAMNQDRLRLLTYLIEQSSLHDLDTRFWGECNNSTLHLACFLENSQVVRLLVEKGVSVSTTNNLGYTPSHITASETLLQYLKPQKPTLRTKSVRPNYSAPDRFKLLKELAEETSAVSDDQKRLDIVLDRKKSDGRFFRKGRVKEAQQKVLTEEEVELEKQRQKRQQEVAQLAKKSAVKNNPLFQKLEKKKTITTLPTRNVASSSLTNEITTPLQNEQAAPKRNSKVISSLKVNSYVTSNVFVQADEDWIEPKLPTRAGATSVPNSNETQTLFFNTEPIDLLESEQAIKKEGEKGLIIDNESAVELLSVATKKENYLPVENKAIYPDIQSYYASSKDSIESQQQQSNNNKSIGRDEKEAKGGAEDTEEEEFESEEENNDDDEGENEEDKVEDEVNDEDDDDEEDDDEDDDDDMETTQIQVATRLASPVYKSVKIIKDEVKPKLEAVNITDKQAIAEPLSPVRPQRSDLRRASSSGNTIANLKKQDELDSNDMKRMSGSQKASWSMSMNSWAAILDREFSLDELGHEKVQREKERNSSEHMSSERSSSEHTSSPPTISIDDSNKLELTEQDLKFMLYQGTASRTSLDNSVNRLSLSLNLSDMNTSTPILPQKSISVTNISAPQLDEIPRLNTAKSILRKPITTSVSEPNIQQHNNNNSSSHNIKQYNIPIKKQVIPGQGKLYLHVNGIQDILLPLPKDRAYVRCVVSDGRFEYMSRYEILSQNIDFNYECVIDTHPDMIITISLHVRPDYVMKSRIPFSRLFSKKKKKECLSGYVNKDDGAIGQARFALAHMIPVCTQTSYLAGFHCFNAWYSRSFKERHRQKKKKRDPDQDVLKVVGNFDVEMLYLPHTGHNKPFPRNLRECDQTIKQLYHASDRYHTF